jgi:hypothetical protein
MTDFTMERPIPFPGPAFFQQEDAGANLLRKIVGGHSREDCLIFDFCHIQHIGCHLGKAQGFLLNDIQILFSLFFPASFLARSFISDSASLSSNQIYA